MNINFGSMSNVSTFVPEHIRHGIMRYVRDHIPPGSFVTAVIQNDLREAVGQADRYNLHSLPTIVAWFYSYAPAPCWGSKEAMENWLRPQGESHG